jgi:hypothetical protein
VEFAPHRQFDGSLLYTCLGLPIADFDNLSMQPPPAMQTGITQDQD